MGERRGRSSASGFDDPAREALRDPADRPADGTMEPQQPHAATVSLPTREPVADTAAEPAAAKTKRSLYDCSKCPGYCCSYPVIVATKYDVGRLARHFSLSFEEAERRFTKSAYGYKRILRRKKDEHYGKICRFFDQTHRRCGIYRARPAVCRSFPGEGHCGYYDFLKFERRTQNDPEFISLTDHS